MTALTLKINLEEGTMRDGFNLADALERVAERIRPVYDLPKHIEEGGEIYGRVFDDEGQPVGRWEVEA